MKRLLQPLAAALCLSAPAAAGIFPDEAFSDSARGTTAAQFLKVPASARLAALGGAGLASYGPDAVFLNPAGLDGRPPGASHFSAGYESLIGESARSGLAYSRGTPRGTFAAGLLYNDSGRGLEALDGAGRAAGGEIAAYDAALGAAWASGRGLLSWGVGLKAVKSRLAEASAAAAALDAGVILKAGPGGTTDLAASFRNLGTPMKLGGESAPLPFEAAGGLLWRYSDSFDILLEGRLPADHASYLVTGGELWLPLARGRRGERATGLSLRAAMNFKNFDDHGFMGAFSGGFGLKAGGTLSFDYAFCPYGDLGAAHRFTIGLGWGGPARRQPPAAARPAAGAEAARETLVAAPFSGEGGATWSQAEVVRGLVESELAKAGRYRLLERNNSDYLLKERRLAEAGLAAESLAAQAGAFLGADSAVFGMVYKKADGYLITVRVVDAATGEILRSETEQARGEHLFREAARRLAALLSEE